jgi:hypothetical protein
MRFVSMDAAVAFWGFDRWHCNLTLRLADLTGWCDLCDHVASYKRVNNKRTITYGRC